MVCAGPDPLCHRRPCQIGDRQGPQQRDPTPPTPFVRFPVLITEYLLHLRPVFAPEMPRTYLEQCSVDALGPRHQTHSGKEGPRPGSSFLARAVSTRADNLFASAPATSLPKSVIL